MAYFCLRCRTNEVSPVTKFSLPFRMRITDFCGRYIDAVAPLTQSSFTLNIPTAPAPNPIILVASDYGYTNDAVNCPLQSYKLKTVSPDADYTGSTLAINAAG